jgi:hypothetical protein
MKFTLGILFGFLLGLVTATAYVSQADWRDQSFPTLNQTSEREYHDQMQDAVRDARDAFTEELREERDPCRR